MRLYDTLTRRKLDFEPRDAGRVSMYVCGPTVYNHIHIGNARTFLSFDMIRRYLAHRFGESNVLFVRNITDVDDKIIAKATEEGRSAAEVAAEYTEAFRRAMEALGVAEPDVEPKATETIPEMIEMIGRLISGGHAYEVDGDVYFSVRSFEGYGKLSGRDVDEMRSGARVEIDERKRDPLDFALWKSAKPGEPSWDSPWGAGRPGWHIECSVMSTGELGESFDIHGGATDLIFPHHENEIAQSEADTGKPFARFWMHGGLLQINEEKMSKSLGNFLLLKDVLEGLDGEYPASVVRLMMLQTHYRSPLDFSTERLDEAVLAYERLVGPVREVESVLDESAAKMGRAATAEELRDFESAIEEARARFDEEMDDDFNTAGALGVVFGLVRNVNSFVHDHGIGPGAENADVLRRASSAIVELMGVLGIVVAPSTSVDLPPEVVALAGELAGFAGDSPEDAIEALLAARAEARQSKDWGRADAIRDGLSAIGLSIEDTPQGARVSRR